MEAGGSFPESGGVGVTGGSLGVLGVVVRGHKLMRDTCEEGDDNVEGLAVGETDPGRQILRVMEYTRNY